MIGRLFVWLGWRARPYTDEDARRDREVREEVAAWNRRAYGRLLDQEAVRKEHEV